MTPIRLFAALFALAAASCASMAGTRQYVSIDSNPRGAEVRGADGTLVGVTPVFVHLERERAHELRLRFPGGGEQPFRMTCDYRWTGALLGNAPFGVAMGLTNPVIGLGVYGVANGVDLATGAAWHCPERLVVPAATPAAPAPGRCPAYVVAPPKHEDSKVSELVAERWRERTRQAEPCASFVDAHEAEQVLRRHGITHVTGLVLERVERRRLNELGFRTGATHLVLLALEGETRLDVRPAVHDLHSLERREGDGAFTIDLEGEHAVPESGLLALAARYVRLLPNAIAFSASSKSFEFERTGAEKILANDAPPSALPAILANWKLLSIEHPDVHGAWAATLRFGPELLVGFDSRKLGLGVDAVERTVLVRVVRGAALYGATATAHTPAGAFSMSLRGGGGVAWHWDDARDTAFDAGVYVSSGTAYTAFVSSSVFLRAGLDVYRSVEPHAFGRGYALATWTQVSLTLGYHVPEARSLVRSLF